MLVLMAGHVLRYGTEIKDMNETIFDCLDDLFHFMITWGGRINVNLLSKQAAKPAKMLCILKYTVNIILKHTFV